MPGRAALAVAVGVLASCAGPRPPEREIVGTWRGGMHEARFSPDGTLRWTTGDREEAGSYTFPGPFHISMRIGDRWAGGDDSRRMGVAVRGDTLELCEDTDPHLCLTFRRAGR